jgi:hypothetical protein
VLSIILQLGVWQPHFLPSYAHAAYNIIIIYIYFWVFFLKKKSFIVFVS